MISPANPQTKMEYLGTFSGHLMPLMLGGSNLMQMLRVILMEFPIKNARMKFGSVSYFMILNFLWGFKQIKHLPASSKEPFDSPNGESLSPLKRSLRTYLKTHEKVTRKNLVVMCFSFVYVPGLLYSPPRWNTLLGNLFPSKNGRYFCGNIRILYLMVLFFGRASKPIKIIPKALRFGSGFQKKKDIWVHQVGCYHLTSLGSSKAGSCMVKLS